MVSFIFLRSISRTRRLFSNIKPSAASHVSTLDALTKNIEDQLEVVRVASRNIRPQMNKKCLNELDTFIVAFQVCFVELVIYNIF
uniref:Uncharacterized protein n=1 Tax=Kalanchoe fedtschenkoi TaxID=63787 RepID=A0A7N0T5J3_KALFE